MTPPLNNNKVVTVIPARYGAQRFPGKPLALIHGKPMIEWVYERASKARGVSETWVATDDERIFKTVEAFGGKVVMTPSSCVSGTDRVYAVSQRVKGDIFINVQGDEPLIQVSAIEKSLDLVTSGRFGFGTAMARFKDPNDVLSMDNVKVLADTSGRAIYFSRYPIPYSRIKIEEIKEAESLLCFRHLGLYVYRREVLEQFANTPPSLIEKAESLEQLRALHSGIAIGVVEVEFESMGVDTPEDLERVSKIIGESKN